MNCYSLAGEFQAAAASYPFLSFACATPHDDSFGWPELPYEGGGRTLGTTEHFWRRVLRRKEHIWTADRWLRFGRRLWHGILYDARPNEAGADYDSIAVRKKELDTAVDVFDAIAARAAGHCCSGPVPTGADWPLRNAPADRWLEAVCSMPFHDMNDKAFELVVLWMHGDIFTTSARMLENQAAIKEQNTVTLDDLRRKAGECWQSKPLDVFSTFCEAVCDALDIVAEIHEKGRAASEQDATDFRRANPEFLSHTVTSARNEELRRSFSEALGRHKLADACPTLFTKLISAYCWAFAVWQETQIKLYLIHGDGPVHLDNQGSGGIRFSASCYHDMGLQLAGGCIAAIQNGWTSHEYASHLRFLSAAGNSVSRHVRSLIASVRCEYVAGVKTFRDESEGERKDRRTAAGKIAGQVPSEEDIEGRMAPRTEPEGDPTESNIKRAHSKEPVPFSGGQMVFFSDRVELCGVDFCSGPRSGPTRKALDLLRQKTMDGTFVAYSGNKLAGKTGRKGGQNSAAGLVQGIRKRISKALRDGAGLACGRFDVILSHGPGYRFANCITVQESDERDGTRIQGHSTPAADCDDPVSDPVIVPVNDLTPGIDDPVKARRARVLQVVGEGRKLRAPAIATELNCSERTVKRDIGSMRAKIEFVGSSRTGYYRLRRGGKPR